MGTIDGSGPTPAEQGITPPGAEAPKPGATAIYPDILSSLGLTQKDVETADKRVLAVREAARSDYRLIIDDTYPDHLNKTFFGPTVSKQGIELLPDRLASGLEDLKPDDLKIREVKIYLEEIGDAALEAGDWKTALNAIDIATDGNVMSNEKLMTKLKEIAAGNKTEGVEIAKTWQGRIEKTAVVRASQATHGAPSV